MNNTVYEKLISNISESLWNTLKEEYHVLRTFDNVVDDIYNDRLGAVRVSAKLFDTAVQTNYRRKSRRKMKVRASELSCFVKNFVNVHVKYSPLNILYSICCLYKLVKSCSSCEHHIRYVASQKLCAVLFGLCAYLL